MIFLTLLYFCFFSGSWNTLALPTDLRPPEILPKGHFQSIFIRQDDRFDDRSVYGILWSCFSTIFASTWIAVHPNIPAPRDSQWVVLGRRLAIMGYFLLAPETVIFWAARQHFAARNFAKKHEEKHIGWTRAHSFFLIMGGFTLHEGGKPVRVLEAKELEELSEAGKIEWPTITKEEIADRSKGDCLSKTIVLLQTIWFIIQCIARLKYRLSITHLEVVTFSFSIFTGIIYYLWLHKPLDVRCSIPVHFLEVSDQEIRGDEMIVDLNSLPSTPIQVDTPTPHPTLTNITNTGSHIIPAEVSDESMPGDEVVIHPNPLPPTPGQDDRSSPDPSLTRQATLFELGYMFIVFPLKRFVNGLGDMFYCNTLGDQTLQVPTFYSSPNKLDDFKRVGILAYQTAIVFGIIHFLGLLFHFVTGKEKIAWIISTIFIIIMSVLARFYSHRTVNAVLSGAGFSDYRTLAHICINLAGLCIYIIARITILVLSFMELRSLPSDAYEQINWVYFLPHI